MPKLTFIETSGRVHIAEGKVGDTLMRSAKTNEVPGVDADCGGGCQCGTCHVYVEPEWQARLGDAGPLEQATLGFATDVRANSRLSCQIKVTNDLNGLVVRLPATQR